MFPFHVLLLHHTIIPEHDDRMMQKILRSVCSQMAGVPSAVLWSNDNVAYSGLPTR